MSAMPSADAVSRNSSSSGPPPTIATRIAARKSGASATTRATARSSVAWSLTACARPTVPTTNSGSPRRCGGSRSTGRSMAGAKRVVSTPLQMCVMRDSAMPTRSTRYRSRCRETVT